uniref:Transposase n=1 Tax=Acrobeloides nanus TaxID=290746 RepID=A0A914BZL3_9BILA
MKLPYTTVRDTIHRYRETGNYNDEYREFLRKKVLPWARRTYGWRNGQWQKQWVFQQDGAPSHRAEETRDLVRDIFPECIEVDISPKRNNGEWPPNSSDLCVEDFSLKRKPSFELYHYS